MSKSKLKSTCFINPLRSIPIPERNKTLTGLISRLLRYGTVARPEVPHPTTEVLININVTGHFILT